MKRLSFRPSEKKIYEAIDDLVERGYIVKDENGRLYPTSKGDDWYYSDPWTDEERGLMGSEEK